MNILNSINHEIKKPLTLLLGGDNIANTITIIENNLAEADNILLGGHVANTFLLSQGFDIGKSDHNPGKNDRIRELMASAEALGKKIILPVDVKVSDKIDEKSAPLDLPVEDIEGDMKILDLGAKTIELYKSVIAKSKTLFWSGAMGRYDIVQYKKATHEISAVLKNSNFLDVVPHGKFELDLLKGLS